jgi:hypothetical protein
MDMKPIHWRMFVVRQTATIQGISAFLSPPRVGDADFGKVARLLRHDVIWSRSGA